MRLFHGSNTGIESIDFEKCKPYKDFGRGFYLTEIEQQAVSMASRTVAIYQGDPVVTAFEFDDTAAFADPALSIKHFPSPDEEWALFVLRNRSRRQQAPTHPYDIVIGPVADDDIATLFRNFEDEIIDLQTMVNGLRYKDVSSQYFFATPVSIAYLRLL